MNNSAGVGKKVLGELKGVIKKTAEDTVKAGIEIVSGGSPSQKTTDGQAGEEKGVEEQEAKDQSQRRARSALGRQKGLDRVRKELADYVAKKKQKDEHGEVTEEREREVKRQEEMQKQETERERQINQARRRGGGTGEIVRRKH